MSDGGRRLASLKPGFSNQIKVTCNPFAAAWAGWLCAGIAAGRQGAGLGCHVTPCHAMPRHATSCHIMPRHATSRHPSWTGRCQSNPQQGAVPGEDAFWQSSVYERLQGQQNLHIVRIKYNLPCKCLCVSQAVWIDAVVASSLPFKLKILLIYTSLQLQFPSAAAVHSDVPWSQI